MHDYGYVVVLDQRWYQLVCACRMQMCMWMVIQLYFALGGCQAYDIALGDASKYSGSRPL